MLDQQERKTATARKDFANVRGEMEFVRFWRTSLFRRAVAEACAPIHDHQTATGETEKTGLGPIGFIFAAARVAGTTADAFGGDEFFCGFQELQNSVLVGAHTLNSIQHTAHALHESLVRERFAERLISTERQSELHRMAVEQVLLS